MPVTTTHHSIVIVGGGSAGISVASRLQRKGFDDVGLIDPASTHYYQPLWTLVGGGRAPAAESARPQADLIPKKVSWIKDAARHIEPGNQVITLDSDRTVTYDHLVVCPGIQLDFDVIPGMTAALDTPAVSTNYTYGLAPKTWARIKEMRSGTAVFTMPAGPIKCAGAPQKIAYLAADYWRRQGVLDQIRVVLVLPTPGMFGVQVFADELERVVAKYGIEVRKSSELTAVDPDGRIATIRNNADQSVHEIHYDFLHVVPPQSAPDWLKHTELADPADPAGYVEIDKNTLQHKRFANIFALGDAGSTPNSKTGAAIRRQAPVVVANLAAAIADTELPASYDGYSSCPLTTARNKMLLAEFDYSMQPHPTFPLIDATHERTDMWYLKRYGLPALYWNLMLKGHA